MAYYRIKRAINNKFPGITTGAQLHNYMKNKFGKLFVGVFACDTIPSLGRHQSCIINTSASNQDGEHWVALLRNSKGTYYFFDSFGRSPQTILPTLKYPVRYDTSDREQRLEDSDCGAHCCAWITYYYIFGCRRLLSI